MIVLYDHSVIPQRLARRSRIEISAEILRAAESGITLTSLLSKTGLSYPLMNDHLRRLQKNRLIAYLPSEKEYTTTKKGTRFLEAYKSFEELTADDSEERKTSDSDFIYRVD